MSLIIVVARLAVAERLTAAPVVDPGLLSVISNCSGPSISVSFVISRLTMIGAKVAPSLGAV